MKLTAEQRKELGTILKQRIGDFPPCAFCKNATGYSIAGSLIAPEGAGPYLAMSCTKCGHTLLFHAKTLGL